MQRARTAGARGLGAALVLVAVVAMAGCEREHGVDIRIDVPDRSAPSSLELRVYEQTTCVDSGTVAGIDPAMDGSVHHQVFAPSEGGMEVGALGGGDHAFAVLGRDGGCAPVLFGCTTAKLSATDVVRIELTGDDLPTVTGCGDGRQCAGDGVCIADGSDMDAAVDAPRDAAPDRGSSGELSCDGVLSCFVECAAEGRACEECVEDAAEDQPQVLAECLLASCADAESEEALRQCSTELCPDADRQCFDDPPDAGPGVTVTQLTAGADYTCALRSDGHVMCWGDNTNGNLGAGEVTDSFADPRAVASERGELLNGVSRIDAGTQHTCARTEDDGLWCWGRNADGAFGFEVEAGESSATPYATRVPDDVLSYVAVDGGFPQHIALGAFHTCVGEGQRVSCFGRDDTSQLGDVDFELSDTEGRLTWLMAGNAFTCAFTEAGSALCWGDDGEGQLGDGTVGGDRATREPVVETDGALSELTAGLAGAFHACAVTGMSEDTYCWGSNADGQLGMETVEGSTAISPAVLLAPGVGVAPIAAGWHHSCFYGELGGLAHVACVGRNDDGQLGDGTTTSRHDADTDEFVDLDGVEQVVAGRAHTCALAAGAVYCWGSNAEQQLGSVAPDTGDMSTTPVEVSGLTGPL